MNGAAADGFQSILYEETGRVATITLNRPDELNPLSHGPSGMHTEVVQALERAVNDERVRCIVITGAGRAFSAGGSMKGGGEGAETAADWLRFHTRNSELNEFIRRQPKPVIGAINGMCYGAALTMASHFDLLVASQSARFGLIETRFGAPGVDMLAYLVGAQWAKFLAISGELIGAERAKQIGLVIEVVEDEKLQQRVADLAARVAAMPAASLLLNRRVVNGALDAMGWPQHKQLTAALDAIVNTEIERASTSDGRRLLKILEEDGWQAYKQARDAPFKEPWLQP